MTINQSVTYYNATIITMDAHFTLIKNGFITISGNTISAIGEGKPVHTGELIDVKKKIIIPGFINAHTHLAMTIYRGLADDLPLHTWLEEHIWPAEAKNTNDATVRTGARLGLTEMIMTGTTTFSDMYFFTNSCAEETVKMGLRGVMGEGVLDFATNSYKKTGEALKIAEQFVERWKNHPLITPAFVFHSTYACGKETLLAVKELALKHKVRLHTHVSETNEEIAMVKEKSGLNPVELLNNTGLLSSGLTAAHCVWTTENDWELFLNAKTSIAHCPTSNLKLGSGIAPVPQMLKMGINVALGTDGCASNNNLDMVEEMRLAALIHKGNQLDPTLITAKEALKMATINGAIALGLDEKIGSLEVGKLADMLFIDINNTFMEPIYDYYSAIVYSMNSCCIDSVMVNGKLLMENRKLKG